MQESTNQTGRSSRRRGRGKNAMSTQPTSQSQAGPQPGPADQNRGLKRSLSPSAPFQTSRVTRTAQAVQVAQLDSDRPPLTIPLPTNTPKFSSLAKVVHPVVLQTITDDLKFDHMTPVQAATVHQLLVERKDVLAQAKTGTGKTIAFLLPAIQTLITRKLKPGREISLLVISPTRELAMQIAKEAKALLQRLPQYRVCLAIGGTNKNTEQSYILKGCDILVGTPGRLLDHLGEESSDVLERVLALDTLVLDEADRLLDMGFLPDLKKIIALLPDKERTERQGMLFSATIADHVNKVAHLALSKDYEFISTIPKGEVNTHQRVPQNLIVVPTFSDLTAGLVGAMNHEIAKVGEDTFKAIVFAQTAAHADFYAAILQTFPKIPTVTVLHSRMTQPKRTRVTDDFRNAANGVLVATDVVARGMDFPSVTNIFQAGLPSDKEAYIHRLGRTARAGAEGRGTLLITSHETFFPNHTLKDIAFNSVEADLSARAAVRREAERLDTQAKVYQAWLGYYKTSLKQLQWDATRLVAEGNKYALDGLGAPEVPTLAKSLVGKMGLKGVKGLVVGPDPPRVHTGRGNQKK